MGLGFRRPSISPPSMPRPPSRLPLPSPPSHGTTRLTRPKGRRAHGVVGRQRCLDEEAQGLPRRPHCRPRHFACQLLGHGGQRQLTRHPERHRVSRRRIPACARGACDWTAAAAAAELSSHWASLRPRCMHPLSCAQHKPLVRLWQGQRAADDGQPQRRAEHEDRPPVERRRDETPNDGCYDGADK